jgi:hypothetical protein
MVPKFGTVALNHFLAALIALFVSLSGACTKAPASVTGGPPHGTEVVVFIDFSGSIGTGDKALYEQDLANVILPSLGEGDRLIIAPISDKTFTDFHPMVEATFPSKPHFNGWMDNVLKYNQQVKDVDAQVAQLKSRLKTEISNLFARGRGSSQTDIFSSLVIAEKLFDNEPRRKVLVLMSDMIQDYPPYRFEKVRWSQDINQQILTDLDARGFVPDLSGVCVYVSGISAQSADMAERISDFWQAYFRRTNADTSSSRYAHVLLHWPPAKSCTWSSIQPRSERASS